jgi:RNA polymerase sigma-70 factor (ECF subfamily)
MSSMNRVLLGQDAKNLPISDEEVVRRVRAGETGLFEVVMRRYNQRLYRVARAILRDDAEAEDVTQQAYVNAYRHLDQFAGLAMFSTWLTKIAVHEALACARRRGRFDEHQEAVDDWDGDTMGALKSPGPDPERQAFAGELRALIESAIEALPEHYRAVFVMRDVEGMSTAESAECLDITEETAKTRLHRARMLLRDALYERAGIESAAAFSFEAPRCDRVVAAVLEQIEAIDQSTLPKPK